MTLTLQTLLHYRTHKVFNSRVKSSEADILFFFNYELPVAVSYRELTDS
jgi:hypothetical protein